VNLIPLAEISIGIRSVCAAVYGRSSQRVLDALLSEGREGLLLQPCESIVPNISAYTPIYILLESAQCTVLDRYFDSLMSDAVLSDPEGIIRQFAFHIHNFDIYNGPESDEYQDSCEHFARRLLDGIDVDGRDVYNRTAMHISIQVGNSNFQELLEEYNVNMLVMDVYGDTPASLLFNPELLSRKYYIFHLSVPTSSDLKCKSRVLKEAPELERCLQGPICSAKLLRRVLRKLSIKYHPDRVSSNEKFFYCVTELIASIKTSSYQVPRGQNYM